MPGCASSAVAAAQLCSVSGERGWSLHRELRVGFFAQSGVEGFDGTENFFAQIPFQVLV